MKILHMAILAASLPACWHSVALGQDSLAESASPVTQPATEWRQIDQRIIFLTVQLGSVEASLTAVDKAIRATGYQQNARLGDVQRHLRGNELMDRNAGGPKRWDEFYGKTAEKFFYNPDPRPNTLRLTASILKTTDPQARQPGPADQRPPQFDYIYRANAEAQKRAEAEAAKLGKKIESLLARQQELHAEQTALWCKLAFHGVISRELLMTPTYRFEAASSLPAADAAGRTASYNSVLKYLRTVNQALHDAEAQIDLEQGRLFTSLSEAVVTARRGMMDALIQHAPAEAAATDSTLSQFIAVSKRMEELASNIADAHRLALDGERMGDVQRMDTFRAALQDSLLIFSESVLAGDECLNKLAADWNLQPDPTRPIAQDRVLPAFTAESKREIDSIPSGTTEPSADVEAKPSDISNTGTGRAEANESIVTITPKSPHGHAIGKVKRGTTITLQYVGGKWKSWGKQATESPDTLTPERGDACRLIIAQQDRGSSEIQNRKIVPPGTSSSPLAWKADSDIDLLILRINDNDGDWASNPDGNVQYRVQVSDTYRVGDEDRAILKPVSGSVEKIRAQGRRFSDRDYKWDDRIIPDQFLGLDFILAGINGSEAVCTKPGTIYVWTHAMHPDKWRDSQESTLVDLGFSKLFQFRFGDDPGAVAVILAKRVEVGERIKLRKLGILIF